MRTDLLGHSWIGDSRSVLTDLRCVLSEGCNRYAGKLLQEYICPPTARYFLAAPGSPDRATNGQSFWRLNVTDTGNGPTLGGYKLNLPWKRGPGRRAMGAAAWPGRSSPGSASRVFPPAVRHIP